MKNPFSKSKLFRPIYDNCYPQSAPQKLLEIHANCIRTATLRDGRLQTRRFHSTAFDNPVRRRPGVPPGIVPRSPRRCPAGRWAYALSCLRHFPARRVNREKRRALPQPDEKFNHARRASCVGSLNPKNRMFGRPGSKPRPVHLVVIAFDEQQCTRIEVWRIALMLAPHPCDAIVRPLLGTGEAVPLASDSLHDLRELLTAHTRRIKRDERRAAAGLGWLQPANHRFKRLGDAKLLWHLSRVIRCNGVYDTRIASRPTLSIVETDMKVTIACERHKSGGQVPAVVAFVPSRNEKFLQRHHVRARETSNRLDFVLRRRAPISRRSLRGFDGAAVEVSAIAKLQELDKRGWKPHAEHILGATQVGGTKRTRLVDVGWREQVGGNP
jgi:hypothetical protein